MKPHLIIGDVHGQYELLKVLLKREGIIDRDGERINKDVVVVQLGDLGHFAGYPMAGEIILPEDDKACFELLANDIIDLMLWGNHDRPVRGTLRMDNIFSGYVSPDQEMIDMIAQLEAHDKIRLAYSVGDFLLTHAGIHEVWGESPERCIEPELVAFMLNLEDSIWGVGLLHDFVDAIGVSRGGLRKFGGIMWRDDTLEPLWEGVRQIYGHTCGDGIYTQNGDAGISYNLDVSKSGAIGYIWLPSECATVIRQDGTISTSKGYNGRWNDPETELVAPDKDGTE